MSQSAVASPLQPLPLVKRPGILKTAMSQSAGNTHYSSDEDSTSSERGINGANGSHRRREPLDRESLEVDDDDEVDRASTVSTGNDSWFDIPLAFAMLPAVGSLLTGSDLLKDFMLLCLLVYYLHILIKVPWDLYTVARSRKASPQHSHYVALAEKHPDDESIRALARTELRLAELMYLSFTIVAPFMGAILLRYVSKLLSIDAVSTFSTSVFVLTTGIRPWRHLIDLLRQRAEILHDTVHLPSDTTLIARLEKLESELHQKLNTHQVDTTVLKADMQGTIDRAIEQSVRSERKAEAAKQALEAKVAALEGTIEELKAVMVAGQHRGPAALGRHSPQQHLVQLGLSTGPGGRYPNAAAPTTITLTLPLPSSIVPHVQRSIEWALSFVPGLNNPQYGVKHSHSPIRTKRRGSHGNLPFLESVYEEDDERAGDGEGGRGDRRSPIEGKKTRFALSPDGRTKNVNGATAHGGHDGGLLAMLARVAIWPVRLMRNYVKIVARIVTGV